MNKILKPARTRRQHSEEFKLAVVTACSAPGASVAGTALAHGVNANQVRRWMAERGVTAQRPEPKQARALSVRPNTRDPAFIPVGVEPARSASPAIQIEMRRGDTALTVSWPVEAAGACAVWLGEWLR